MAVGMPFFSSCTQGPELRAQFPRQQGREQEFHLLEAGQAVNRITARRPAIQPFLVLRNKSHQGQRLDAEDMFRGDRWGDPEPEECGGGGQRLLLESHSSPATFSPQTEGWLPFVRPGAGIPASPTVEKEPGQPW